MDIYGAFQLCAIGILTAPATVRLSRTYFGGHSDGSRQVRNIDPLQKFRSTHRRHGPQQEQFHEECLAAVLLFPAIAALHGIVLAAVHVDGESSETFATVKIPIAQSWNAP
jgi:hypothetical protein